MDASPALTTVHLPTPLGVLTIQGTLAGIVAVRFSDDAPPAADFPTPPPVLIQALTELRAYFAGNLRAFSVPVLPQGTPFQFRVWEAVSAIPFGATRSYLEIARAVGDEGAVRAVGAANGANPVPILVPCHRVIGSDGSLIGYGGGLWRKEWLLAHEGRPVQPRLFDA
jgi:methylated-DNA-[protein]-cysteine S-methyltransferase